MLRWIWFDAKGYKNVIYKIRKIISKMQKNDQFWFKSDKSNIHPNDGSKISNTDRLMYTNSTESVIKIKENVKFYENSNFWGMVDSLTLSI